MNLLKPWNRKQTRPDNPTTYPDGIAVDTEDAVWYIKNQRRLRVYSSRVLMTWHLPVARGTESSLANYKKAGILGFRDGSLIKDVGDNKIYLISGNKRRHIQSPDAFDLYGLSKKNLIFASSKEVNLHEEGAAIE